MAKKNDHLADFATENTGGLLTGFLADEEHLDRRAMLRLGTWGAASVGAIVVALLANQSSLRLRHDELAAADLSRQSQQIQSVARESQNETRRLASAIDTLNGDRDRVYSRLSTLEQGLDSVTGAIARQNSGASSAPATPAPVAASAPQPAADGATPAPAPEAAATEPAPLIGPVATTTAVIIGKQAAEAKRREQANAKMAAAVLPPIPAPLPAPSNAPATTATMAPLVAAKSMMGPPDPAAPKLIEPEPAKTAAAPPTSPQAAPAPAAQTVQATPAAAPESAAATLAADKAATDKPANETMAAAETPPQASPQLAVSRTEFGVDVGGANSVGGLRALWRGLLKSRSNAPLASLQPIIVIKEGNNGLGLQLRLVAGPLTDAAAAAKICATMVENERPCATAVYDGQHLALKTDDLPFSTGTISPKTSAERSSETPETAKPAGEKRAGSGRQWRRHSYQKRAVVEEPPPEKPKPTAAGTIASFFHRSN